MSYLILLLSLGNPAPLRNSLHSAGHHALDSLQRVITPHQPPFSLQIYGRKACQVSVGVKYILAQSPMLMNVSGPWVNRTRMDVMAKLRLKADELAVVVVHDDLEEELGHVRMRDWDASARGHNGVKSVLGTIRPEDSPQHGARISIGIGRPEERDKNSVAHYVLKDMTQGQRTALENTGSKVLDCLLSLEEKWERGA
ncbi:peptidyl-tRNA hydrolase [Durotheca rogersii]|uniref:peptidyl-tRNA hydrolase n=1 Tax=Durotheca rogersii TaxID=419775 RepID=UPI00221F1978|nr:peptidyl-tRNA hydrolase [Durotheca rogersii]KAI5865284.1 peptidyl-tRNA hydrolase [Durotheca rogersii]